MKLFLVGVLIFISVEAFSAVNPDVECTRTYEKAEITYSFHFPTSRRVEINVLGVSSEGEIRFSPVGKSVPFSAGRMVGVMNEITAQEELFLIPHAVFDSLEVVQTEVMLRDTRHFFVSCRGF